MNTNLTAKYIQFLRKSHNYTQEELAKKLDISRQAVSKWETGVTIPDLDVLLKISKLYGISINDILEPKIQPQRIADFEQITTIPEKELKEILEQFDTDSLVIALMGASPDTNQFFEELFPEIDFEETRNKIGRVRVETVEEMQEQIVSMINLLAVDGKGGTNDERISQNVKVAPKMKAFLELEELLVPVSQELDYKKELAEARDKYDQTYKVGIDRQSDSGNENKTTRAGRIVSPV